MKKIVLLICFLCFVNQVFATKYYCDPARGNMKNDGTSKSPWSTLDSVFIVNKKLLPGDTVFLRTGYHGFPIIKGNLESSGYITILPQSGHQPTASKIIIENAKNWKIVGLKVNPDFGLAEKGELVSIKSNASFITIENFNISSTDSCINKWTAGKLLAKARLAIRVEGQDCTLTNNTIKQVTFGVSVAKTAVRTKFSRNVIYGFLHDGMRGLSDDSIFEYNFVAGSYAIDDNHDDGFQSWSTDENGKVGMGKVSNVTLRGNVFISQLDPDQPFPQEKSGMQGIGCFDGFFENWTVENNVVITNMWHGISFYGAKNVKITNNTLLSNPLQTNKFAPWIGVYSHKKLGESIGNTVSNNLTTGLNEMKGVITNSNNLKISPDLIDQYLENWMDFDIRLKSGKNTKANVGAELTDLPRINHKLYACSETKK
ncbi:right-handed parallel beta-helix repeat-containing protein [uncultured Pedobacter sp.]|uniref:right-handed parallel beta-helix repeat-containing protein n=1 Tax=uncultured Pedobacter sp. TaxID=246139 RepID=UPI00260C9AF9|nr:right-handed parallel beta-helix repeat-containing protein [uncultured Pedobacter sp.]